MKKLFLLLSATLAIQTNAQTTSTAFALDIPEDTLKSEGTFTDPAITPEPQALQDVTITCKCKTGESLGNMPCPTELPTNVPAAWTVTAGTEITLSPSIGSSLIVSWGTNSHTIGSPDMPPMQQEQPQTKTCWISAMSWDWH